MKRIVALLMAIAMLLSICACGGSESQTNPDAGITGVTESLTPTADKNLLEDFLNIKSDDDPVDIYLSIMDFEGIGAEAYIAQMQEENPDGQYRYYNEEYYIETITEGERKELLARLKDVDTFFDETFAADNPGLFIKAELNKDMDELVLHFNKDAYESDPFMGFSVLIMGAAYLDAIQGYNLVSPENRDLRLLCVDENGETLIDTDLMEESSEDPVAESTIAKAAYTLTDHVVVDDEHCTFIIKNVDPNGDWGFTLNVFCENKTDKNLMFSWDDVSVMGFMADPFWAVDVAAGKKANESISFSYDTLETIGMEAVDDITFTLRISDSDDWSVDPILVEEFAVYPTGKSIQDISYPSRMTTENEVVLYDTDEYSFVILSSETKNGDYLVYCYLENKTGHEIMFSMDNVSANGFMADPCWGDSVAAGKKLYSTVCFYESVLTENGITDIEDIEFTLRVSNADTWDTHVSEVFTYIPG